MPLWNSNRKKDYSEHAPLSTRDDDDDEEEPALPPYSDAPSYSPYSDNPNNNGNGNTFNMDNNGGGGSDDDGFGEGDFYHNGSNNSGSGGSYSKLSNSKRNSLPHRSHYRTGLICAYLKYMFTCCGCLGGTRTKRFLMCLFYLVLFVTIMVCAAAVGYIIARDGSYQKTHYDDDTPTTAAGGATTTIDTTKNNNGGTTSIINTSKQQQQHLPPPPQNLHELCSDWITESGRQKCQSECTKAACCSLPASNANSCWEDQAGECATYRAACMALELHSNDGNSGGGSNNGGGGVIGPKTILYAPPSNLSVVCSSTALATPGGFDNCANVCRPSRCCFPDQFDCNLADDRYCEDYEEVCASVAESWRGSGHAVATSSSSTSSTTTTTSGASPTIANEVMKACNAANLNPPNDCIEACKPGACCYVSTSYQPIEQLFSEYYGMTNTNPMETLSSSCASSVGFCQQYGSCEHLNHMKDVAGWHSEEVNYVVDVATPCKVEHIAQFGALQCSNVCQPAHCCFSEEYGCDDVELGHLDCEDYSDCLVLYPPKQASTKELLKLAERIDDACSESSLNTIGGRSECHEVCKDHSCCFDQVGGCMDNPALNCLAYAGCEPYYNVPTGGGQVSIINNDDNNNKNNNNAGGGIGSDEEMDMEIDGFVTELEQICSEENLRSINGIYKCHNKCQSHLCCFVSDDDKVQYDCSSQRPTACSVYEPCQKLVKPTDGNEPVRPLEPEDIEQIVFDACYFGADPLKITEDMVQRCHGVCAQRLCCFSDYLLQSSCRDTVGDDECHLYSLCEQLVTDDGVEVGNAIDLQQNEFDVDHLCSPKVAEDPDLFDACKGLCTDRRSCCFDKSGYSCYDMEKDWCDEYKNCERTDLKFSVGVTMSNGSGGSSGGNDAQSSSLELIEKEVYDACYFGDDESRVTQELVTKCLNVCQPRLCCFDSYKLESSCRATVGEDECELFDLCEQMITDDGGVVKTFIELDFKEFDDDDSIDESSTLKSIDESKSNSASGSGSSVQYPSGNTGIASSLENICSESSLKTLEGLQSCHNKCQTHLCCFTTDPKLAGQNCAGLIPAGCSAYEPCKKLVFPPAGTEPAVSPTALLTQEETEKRVYDACYFGNDPTRVTEKLVTNCHAVCAERLCCFSDYSLQSSCRATLGDDECDLFSLCEQLITENGVASDALDVEENEFGVDELCIDKVAVNPNLYSACSEVCERRSCCFESDPNYSCYNLEKDWCDEYKACEVVEYNFYH